MTDERTFTLHQVGQGQGRLRDHRGQASGDPRPARAGADAGGAGADGTGGVIGGAGCCSSGWSCSGGKGCDVPMLLLIIIRLLFWVLLSLCFRVLLIVLTVTEVWRWHRRERRWSGPVAVEMRR